MRPTSSSVGVNENTIREYGGSDNRSVQVPRQLCRLPSLHTSLYARYIWRMRRGTNFVLLFNFEGLLNREITGVTAFARGRRLRSTSEFRRNGLIYFLGSIGAVQQECATYRTTPANKNRLPWIHRFRRDHMRCLLLNFYLSVPHKPTLNLVFDITLDFLAVNVCHESLFSRWGGLINVAKLKIGWIRDEVGELKCGAS